MSWGFWFDCTSGNYDNNKKKPWHSFYIIRSEKLYLFIRGPAGRHGAFEKIDTYPLIFERLQNLLFVYINDILPLKTHILIFKRQRRVPLNGEGYFPSLQYFAEFMHFDLLLVQFQASEILFVYLLHNGILDDPRVQRKNGHWVSTSVIRYLFNHGTTSFNGSIVNKHTSIQ